MADEVTLVVLQFLDETDLLKKAKLLYILKRDYEVSLTQISKQIHMKASYVSHILRLNRLPALIVDGYYSKTVSPTHLFVISRLKSEEDMILLYEKILSENLNVIQTEYLVRDKLYGIKDAGDYVKTAEIETFISSMKKKGVMVQVIQSRIKGKIIIETAGGRDHTSAWLREVMRLCEHIGGQIITK